LPEVNGKVNILKFEATPEFLDGYQRQFLQFLGIIG
jgi:hypothetical protein